MPADRLQPRGRRSMFATTVECAGKRFGSGAPQGGLRSTGRPDTAREANRGRRRSGR